MREHIVFSVSLPNKASGTLSLSLIQPLPAFLQAVCCSVECDPPNVDDLRLELDLILLLSGGKMLYRLKYDPHSGSRIRAYDSWPPALRLTIFSLSIHRMLYDLAII